jgi:putative hydrolase of HD superfamily
LTVEYREPVEPPAIAASARLQQQIAFLVEIDHLKQILRRTRVMGGERRENSAEHSWHIAVIALVLAEYAAEAVDVGKVIKMLLVHDIVEIDAGDTFAYDVAGYQDKDERERTAADRLFGLLPQEQEHELRGLWEEFEAQETPDARFANMADRLMPVLQNYHNGGGTWREAAVDRQAVDRRMQPLAAAPAVHDYVKQVLDSAVAQGMIRG